MFLLSVYTLTYFSAFHPRSTSGTPSSAPLAVTASVLAPSGQPMDHYDLHVGAELRILGRKVTLKKVGAGREQGRGEEGQWICPLRRLPVGAMRGHAREGRELCRLWEG